MQLCFRSAGMELSDQYTPAGALRFPFGASSDRVISVLLRLDFKGVTVCYY